MPCTHYIYSIISRWSRLSAYHHQEICEFHELAKQCAMLVGQQFPEEIHHGWPWSTMNHQGWPWTTVVDYELQWFKTIVPFNGTWSKTAKWHESSWPTMENGFGPWNWLKIFIIFGQIAGFGDNSQEFFSSCAENHRIFAFCKTQIQSICAISALCIRG